MILSDGGQPQFQGLAYKNAAKNAHLQCRNTCAIRRLSRRRKASTPYGCGCSSGVEHDLAKVGVEGSNPFARSNHFRFELLKGAPFDAPSFVFSGPVVAGGVSDQKDRDHSLPIRSRPGEPERALASCRRPERKRLPAVGLGV